METLPSNSSVIVERVPIEFADFSYRPLASNYEQHTAMEKSQHPQPVHKNSYDTHNKIVKEPSKIVVNTNSNVQPPSNELQPLYQPHDNIEPLFTREEYDTALSRARYFIIRSANQENVMISKEHGEWATTRSNEAKLNEAYSSIPHVFLIFAVSKTFYFQGIARMSSPISNKIGIFWKNIDAIKLGGCFKVQWITSTPLSFNRIVNLTNSYNDNEPLRKSRDGTEIDPKVGRELCLMFEVPFRDRSVPPPSFIANAYNKPAINPVFAGIMGGTGFSKPEAPPTEEHKPLPSEHKKEEQKTLHGTSNSNFSITNLLNPQTLMNQYNWSSEQYQEFLKKVQTLVQDITSGHKKHKDYKSKSVDRKRRRDNIKSDSRIKKHKDKDKKDRKDRKDRKKRYR